MHKESNLALLYKGQGQPRFISCANLVGPKAKYQVPSLKATGLLVPEKILKGDLPYMGMVAILVM